MIDRLFYPAVLLVMPALLVLTIAESLATSRAAEARAAAPMVIQLERVVITPHGEASPTAVAAASSIEPAARAVQ